MIGTVQMTEWSPLGFERLFMYVRTLDVLGQWRIYSISRAVYSSGFQFLSRVLCSNSMYASLGVQHFEITEILAM